MSERREKRKRRREYPEYMTVKNLIDKLASLPRDATVGVTDDMGFAVPYSDLALSTIVHEVELSDGAGEWIDLVVLDKPYGGWWA